MKTNKIIWFGWIKPSNTKPQKLTYKEGVLQS